MEATVPPDTNLAPGFVIPCGILAVIGACLCSARILTRLRPAPHLHWDDYLILGATILSLLEYIVACICAAHGWGHMSPYVSQTNQTIAFKCLFAMQMIWIFATALVRISVAVSLLHLGRCAGGSERLWKLCLWSLIGIQILTSMGWIILLVFNCHPLRGLWDPVPALTCWPHKYTANYGWVANPIVICIDFTLATMPLQLIRSLNRSLRERILIGCLMATGLIATIIAGYKMTLSQEANVGDLLSTTVKLSLWCKLEEQVGIIAACLPCLKAQMERILYRVGVLKDRLPSFGVSLGHIRFGNSPSQYPHIASPRGAPDTVCDTGLPNFVTDPEWSTGTTDSAKSKSTAASSEISEVQRKDGDV